MSKIDLCWIDDSPKDMYLIMRHAFPILWDKEYSCKTILFGNEYCDRENEDGPTEADRAAFEIELTNLFIVFCQKIDEREWKELGSTYKEKTHLLPRPSVSLVPMRGEGKDGSDSIKQLAKNWMDHDKLKKLMVSPDGIQIGACAKAPLDSGELSVDKLVEVMDIPDDAAVALDICLLYDEINRIEAGLPSISMALYASLSKQRHCYLYTGRHTARTLLDRWVKTYQQLFGSKEELKIYSKKGLTTKQDVTDAKTDLIDLLGREV